ncbi:MAG: PTS sugar transporter subunit IIA [Candidatus Hydrogenedentes bacterium]|nr:PTS sugar transporter subunit IIA [Candidatus Hydrogenedentota bacterium]
MKGLAYIDETLVLPEAVAPDKWQLISLMVDTAMASKPLQAQKDVITRERLLDGVMGREHERSTGLGNGVAFPHARVSGLRSAVVCVAFLEKPVDFESIDDKPVDLSVLILVPEDQPQTALQLMSQFARLLSDSVEREALMGLRTVSGLCGFISRHVLEKDASVTACDIMRELGAVVRPDTPLQEVTRIMNQYLMDTIAVTEEDDTLVGEITCDDLFKRGMPHFFTQLKSIAFIREFDPFEKYFADENKTLAQDVMSKNYAIVSEEATLLEIIFELAVHHHPKVYVVRDGKQVGVIDRILVLDRVINV